MTCFRLFVATAGVLAIECDKAVQDVPYSKLAERLLSDAQRLEIKRK